MRCRSLLRGGGACGLLSESAERLTRIVALPGGDMTLHAAMMTDRRRKRRSLGQDERGEQEECDQSPHTHEITSRILSAQWLAAAAFYKKARSVSQASRFASNGSV